MLTTMCTKHIIKQVAARLLPILLIIVFSVNVFGQANITLDQPNTGGVHTASVSITLLPGFTSANGFHAYINGAANCIPLAASFSDNQNYIVTSIVRVPGVHNSSFVPNMNSCEVNQTVQYLDGLGRPLQTVMVKGNADATKDVVQPFTFDEQGREIYKYLPYASTTTANGSYKPDALSGTAGYSNSGQFTYYNNSSAPVPGLAGNFNTAPYAQTVYENSPLNRVSEQGAPGAAWQIAGAHTAKNNYDTNIATEVEQWSVTSTGATAAWYAPGQLYKTVSKDENWTTASLKAGTTEEFKDKEGHVVLKRVWETDTKSLSTYYVYNDLSELSYVLPPAVNENGQATLTSFAETDATFNNFIYGYHYDNKQRLAEKKIPGKGWEAMVYNKLDQVIFTQDAKQKNAGQWLFTKYDAFGRAVVTGLCTDASTRAALQATADGQTVLWEQRDNSNNNGLLTGYTNTAIPTANINAYHTISYYDDYNFYGNTFGQPNGVTQVSSANTKGLVTGTKINILGTSTMLLSVNYYDDEGRIVNAKAQNHLGGIDSVANTWNFAGELTASTRTHIANSTTTLIATRYEYDHMGRKKEAYEKINNEPEVQLSASTYNDVGQVLNKALGNSLQTVSYAYNERGWMRTATTNGNLFNLELKYNEDNSGMFNGNISQMNYNTTNVSNPGGRNFMYSYDKLNRLTNAVFTGGQTGDNLGEQISYDVMGNISQLIRSGTNAGTLNYTSYIGNHLNTVTGYSPRNYSYDDNGNATSDGMGKGITYNLFNLPQTVTQTNSIATLATYTYDATAQKLKNTGSDGTWDYINGIVYKNNAIKFINTEEGRAEVKNDGTYHYEYNLKDHLGNNRVSFDQYNNAARMIQEDEYYSFGLRKTIGGYDLSSNNRYLYNGKEIQTDLTNQYDYGARFYDPVIGRWTSVDPLAEQERRATPYSYTFDDPIRHTDPDGMFGEAFNDGDCCKGLSAPVRVTGGAIIGGSLGVAGVMVTGGIVTGPGELVIAPAAGLVIVGGVIAGGAVGAYSMIAPSPSFSSSNSSSTDNSPLAPQYGSDSFAMDVQSRRIAKTQADTEGVIYKRTDKNSKQKPYIGQAKSNKRYDARQKEHGRANKDADYEFEVIDRGKPGKDLNEKEQKHLDANNGPTNKSNPDGGTSNKKNVIKRKK